MVKPIVLYRTRIDHRRSHPVEHRFSYRGYWWLLDIDRSTHLPRGLFATLKPQDYCGDPALSIATNIRQFLAENGCDTSDITILMLTTPRQFGYTFNPITMFYCHRSDGTTVAHIAEVHNTYGGRHRYLLLPNTHEWSDTAKHLYVSPFYDVSGEYRIYSPAPDSKLSLTVRLNRTGEPPFIASVTGERIPITRRTVAAALLLGSPLLTTARIRFQGIRLWLKKLPVQPREQSIGACRG